MPIYEYLCEECGRVTEVMQKISDRPPATCSECGSRKIAKLVSRTAFQLKGGGWYADLYSSPRKDGGPAAKAGEPPAPAGGEAAKPSPAATDKGHSAPATPAATGPAKAAPNKAGRRGRR